MIHAYTGDGKGKTCSAIGLGMIARAKGHNQKVALIQLIKSSKSGEITFLQDMGIEVYQFGNGFVREASNEDTESAQKGIEKARELILDLNYYMIVLDEALTACEAGILSEQNLLSLIQNANGSELVLTGGTRLPESLEGHIDYHTELANKKHPYKQGVKARPGIEY